MNSMEIIFVRHGHGEHLLDYPNRLNTIHPGLTDYGRYQIDQLKERVTIIDEDMVIISPTKRTIETGEQLLDGKSYYVSPHVGPRMFPQKPELSSLLCDLIYTKEEIIQRIGQNSILDFNSSDWGIEGINRIEGEKFEDYASQLISWCKDKTKRVFIISHDGTITNYRVFLGEKGLTRKDFLGEAGVCRIRL